MMISRRTFCSVLGAAGAMALSGSRVPPTFGAESSAFELRVIAYNILKCTAWPADRVWAKKVGERKQITRRMALELDLYDPQIINFSEAPAEPVVKEIADHLGMKYVYFPSGKNWPGAILTRFEIEESRNVPLVAGERPSDLYTRHWGRATLRLPDDTSLVVHSAHLFPGPGSTERRLKEIEPMLAAMHDDLANNRPALLLGDLNHRPDTPEYQAWIDAGWIDTFAAVGEGEGLTVPASTPHSRIDYVLAAGPLAKQVTESRPLFEGAFRTNPADDRSAALSDHVPQYAAFSVGSSAGSNAP